jgi:ferredoxin
MSREETVDAEGALRAVVDRDECFGFGNCVATAPAVFQLDAEGTSVAADIEADPALLDAAVDGCPRGAISLIRVRVTPGALPQQAGATLIIRRASAT